jgi:putative peptidoglycan lipid II flippase
VTDLARDTRTVAGATLVSRVFGLVRDLVMVRIFGDTAVGSAFNAAFALPNLFRRLFGEGALSAAFIPRYAAIAQTDSERADRYASLVLAALALVTAAITIAGEALLLLWLLNAPADADRSLSIRLMMIMLPLMPLVCGVAILGGMLQVRGRFAMPAAAPIVLNVCMIAAGGAAIAARAEPERAALLIAIATIVSGVLQLAWALAALRRLVRFSIRFGAVADEARGTLRRFLPVLVGLGTLQINSLADTVIAMWPTWVGPTMFGRPVPLDQASNAVLGFTQRLYQFPLGVFGIAVATAAFPQLSRDANDPQRFGDTLARGVRLSLFIGLPASAGLLLVREDIIRVMFSGGGGFSEDGLARAASVLAGYALAVWAYSLNHLLTRACYAQGDTASPMRISLVMVAVNIALNLALIWRFKEAGLAWATAATATLQAVALSVTLRRSTPHTPPILPAFVRLLALSLAMGALVWGVRALAPAGASWNAAALRLALATAAGIGGYAALARLARAPELGWLLARAPRSRDDGQLP